jgi:hypothetical protein
MQVIMQSSCLVEATERRIDQQLPLEGRTKGRGGGWVVNLQR